ncbi:MAG: hypothetical protein H7312_14310 [Tardiphaga sp.]|nr:hypothetical protein [Tardiphaga sp.]
MGIGRQQGLFVCVSLVIALVVGCLTYFAMWGIKVSSCRFLDQPDTYLSYCNNPAFSDYEHQAYFLPSEPQAISALKRAEVVFLGSSRMQIGFSTDEVGAYFTSRLIPYHLLGFGYTEADAFPLMLMKEYNVRPRVVIINTDPFFTSEMSAMATGLISDRYAAIADAIKKKVFFKTIGIFCWMPGICTGERGSIYRDLETGRWIWQGLLMPRSRAVAEIPAERPAGLAAMSGWIERANRFLDELKLDRRCVIFTGIPNPTFDAEAIAIEIGRSLGVTSVVPRLEGLTSPDASHLSAPSAELWSAAFLSQSQPVFDRCLPKR